MVTQTILQHKAKDSKTHLTNHNANWPKVKPCISTVIVRRVPSPCPSASACTCGNYTCATHSKNVQSRYSSPVHTDSQGSLLRILCKLCTSVIALVMESWLWLSDFDKKQKAWSWNPCSFWSFQTKSSPLLSSHSSCKKWQGWTKWGCKKGQGTDHRYNSYHILIFYWLMHLPSQESHQPAHNNWRRDPPKVMIGGNHTTFDATFAAAPLPPAGNESGSKKLSSNIAHVQSYIERKVGRVV